MFRNTTTSAILSLLLMATTATRRAAATATTLHKHLSFTPPFLDVDHFGKRMVGFEWDMTGVAKAMKNFVRLTPDQQASEMDLDSQNSVLCRPPV